MQTYGWRRTHSINLAAALFVCGVKVLPLATLHERTGKRITEFHLKESSTLPAASIPETDPDLIRARFSLHSGPSHSLRIETGPVRLALESGDMDTADPCHPALDALRVLEARECLRTFMERGTRYRIQLHPTAPRARYVEGQEPLTARMGTPGFLTWHTQDLAIAAAVSRIGCPVLGIEGARPHRRFILPRFGHPLPGRTAPEDAPAIIAALHSGELMRQCPEHPVVWGYYAIKARMMLMDAIENRKGQHSQVFLAYENTTTFARHRRSCLVEERASDKVLDQARLHLRA